MKNPAPHNVIGHHRTPLRLSRRRRHLIYAIGGTLWLSGALWLICHYFLMTKGPFGDTPSPLEPWWMRLHGAMAFGALWLFGLTWGVHIVAGWKTGRQRITGSIAAGVLAWLVISGYLLYYLTDDTWRNVSVLAHWTVGLALPVLLALHIVMGRKRATRSVQSNPNRD
jgi:hypothetical protein